MGIIDIITRAFETANKNLMLLLIYGVVWFAVVALAMVGLIFIVLVAAGTISSIPESPQDIEMILETLMMSAGFIVVGVAAFLVFMLVVWAIYALLQAGTVGCILKTVTGRSPSYSWDDFFDSVKKYGLSMFWLNFLWAVIGMVVTTVFALIGVIGVFGVLMPINDAGNQTAAFGIGVPFITVLVLLALVFWFFAYAGAVLSGVVLVHRDVSAVNAISEGLDFIRANFWDVVLLSLTLVAGSFAVSFTIMIIKMVFGFIPIIGPFINMGVGMVEMVINIYISIIITGSFAVILLERTGELPAPAPAYPPPAPHVGPEAYPTPYQAATEPAPEPGPDEMSAVHAGMDYAVEPTPSELDAEIRDESPEPEERAEPPVKPWEDTVIMAEPVVEAEPDMPFVIETPPAEPSAPPAPAPQEPETGKTPPVIETEEWPPFEPKKPENDDETRPG